MISNGQKTPLYFQLSKEENEWKVDLTSIFPQVNIGLKKMLSEQGLTRQIVKEIFTYGVALGGTISGEHGVGLIQQEYLDVQLTDIHINVLQRLKQHFDLNEIMNSKKCLYPEVGASYQTLIV